jgi:hypothetical protein
MMSADSFAMSTAESTEIPTAAFCIGVSFANTCGSRTRVARPAGVAAREHGDVEEIAQPGLIGAVEIGVREYLIAVLPEPIDVTLQDHAVLGQRPGLVRAQHVHRSEVRDRVQALHDHLAVGHRDRPLREVHGDDHRQHLGRQSDRDGGREQQRLDPSALGQPIDQEHRRRNDQDETDHQSRETVDVLVEAARRACGGDDVRDAPEIGALAGERMTLPSATRSAPRNPLGIIAGGADRPQ